MHSALVDMAVGVGRWRTSAQLAVQDIELRYKRSLLGPFWISAALVSIVLALAYVFADAFGTGFLDYISFVGAGLLAWQLILALVNEGCNSVIEHSGFLQNLRLPMTVISGRILVRNAIVFAHNLVAIAGVLMLFGVRLTPSAVLALPGALVILVLGYFLSMVLGPLCARFRDLPLIVGSGMQVVFFLTPIFWTPSTMGHRPIFTHGNPFYHLIELVRAPLRGEPTTALNWQVSLWCCAIAAVLAVATISATRKRINLWL